MNHPAFTPPKNSDVKIWRYMDFTKFISMLENQALFFARVDRLGDPFEGSYSRGNEKLRKIKHKGMRKAIGTFQEYSQLMESNRKWTMISCWHMNDHESAGMWKLYAQTNESIAIQSTYKLLRKHLSKSIYIGVVRYIDYETEWMPEENVYFPYTHKRKSFEHEKELRAVECDVPVNDDGYDDSVPPPEYGVWKQVDLSQLIEKIYLAPTSPSWFEELLNKVCKRYGLKKEIIRSSLENEPFF